VGHHYRVFINTLILILSEVPWVGVMKAYSGLSTGVWVVIAVVLLLIGIGSGYAIGTMMAPPRVTTMVSTVTAPGAPATVTVGGAPSGVQTVTQAVTVAATQAPAAQQIMECRLGFAMAVSGPFAVDGPVRRDAGILAIDEVNKYLESIGAPIRFRYVHDDTKGTAADALKVIQSMYGSGIRVVIGPFGSGEVRGVIDFANSNKMVIISPSSTSPLLAAPDYVFRMAPTDLFQGKVLAQLMNSLGIKKVAAIVRNDDYGRGLLGAFKDAFTSIYGGVVREILYQVGQPDYASEVSQLSRYVRELGADSSTAVLIIAFEDDGLNIMGHARLDPVLSSVRWFGGETLNRPAAYLPPPSGRASPEIAEFLNKVKLTGVFASPKGSPMASTFEQAYMQRFGRTPSPWAYFTYDAVWLAAMTILFTGGKCYDADAVKNALPIVAQRFIGVTGWKAFDANGDVAGADYTIWQYRLVGGNYSFATIGTWRYPAGTIEITG